MTPSPLRRLTQLDIRRIRPEIVRTLIMLAGVLGFLVVIGRATPGNVAMMLVAIAFAVATIFSPNQLRDKLDGGYAFLLGLPVERSTLAMARCLAAGLLMIPGSLLLLSAWYLTADTVFPPGSTQPGPAGVALVAWSVLTAMSVLLSGLLVRFKMEHVLFIPLMVVIGASFVLDPVLTPHLPDRAAVARFLARPDAAMWIEGGILAVSGAVMAIGYFLLRWGLETFQQQGQ